MTLRACISIWVVWEKEGWWEEGRRDDGKKGGFSNSTETQKEAERRLERRSSLVEGIRKKVSLFLPRHRADCPQGQKISNRTGTQRRREKSQKHNSIFVWWKRVRREVPYWLPDTNLRGHKKQMISDATGTHNCYFPYGSSSSLTLNYSFSRHKSDQLLGTPVLDLIAPMLFGDCTATLLNIFLLPEAMATGYMLQKS